MWVRVCVCVCVCVCVFVCVCLCVCVCVFVCVCAYIYILIHFVCVCISCTSWSFIHRCVFHCDYGQVEVPPPRITLDFLVFTPWPILCMFSLSLVTAPLSFPVLLFFCRTLLFLLSISASFLYRISCTGLVVHVVSVFVFMLYMCVCVLEPSSCSTDSHWRYQAEPSSHLYYTSYE